MEISEELNNLIVDLREYLKNNVSTKDDKIPRGEDLSVGKVNKLFDIDIFFSRKPGMRRSIQLITSNSKSKEGVKVSCLVAVASLLDTMLDQKQLGVTKEDIVKMFITWMNENGITIVHK